MGSVYSLTIKEATLEQGKEGGTYKLYASWVIDESVPPYTGQYQVVLSDIGKNIDSQEVTEQEVTFDSVKLDLNKTYSLTVSVKDQPEIIDSIDVTADTYRNARGKYNGKTLTLLWDTPAASMAGGECIVTTDDATKAIFSYKIQAYASGMEIALDEKFYGGDLKLSVELTPQWNDIFEGITVSLPMIFNPKYTASVNADKKKEISYQRPEMTENKLIHTFDGDIYAADPQKNSKAPDEPVVQGPLELGNKFPYTLTVKTDRILTRSDYDAFIEKIAELVTAKAMYQILELVARCAKQSPEDILYFHCGLRPDKRSVDLRPGLTLRLEQEMYMPNVQLVSTDAAGFIGTHTAEYLISYMQGSEKEYLEFDSFVDLMDEAIYSSGGSTTDVKPIGAGILDLCAVGMRNPYYRIQYPDALYSSDVGPDVHAANHVILLAAAGWKEVPLPPDLPSGSTPYLLFRGRSALTLLITVNINGKLQKVPIGTTLGKMLKLAGIYAGAQSEICLYRRTAFGDEAQISFADGLWEEMPLLHGDRIEG